MVHSVDYSLFIQSQLTYSQLTLRPDVVQIRSRVAPESGANETEVVHRLVLLRSFSDRFASILSRRYHTLDKSVFHAASIDFYVVDCGVGLLAARGLDVIHINAKCPLWMYYILSQCIMR